MSNSAEFLFQFPINEKLFDSGPGHVKYFFVGNLNVCYERTVPDLNIKWITWDTSDEVKTQIQDLVRAIAPDLYEQITEAMHQNFEIQNEPWANGDDDNWVVTAADFEE